MKSGTLLPRKHKVVLMDDTDSFRFAKLDQLTFQMYYYIKLKK